MISNGLRTLWDKGEPVVNGWLSIANSFSAEVMAAQGFDSLTVDTQHGIVDYADAVTMLQAMRASGVTPIVRVPWLDPAPVMKALDAGAFAIICPMINSRAEAERLVSYMRYPPKGTRSFGPSRANISAGGNYAAEANDQLVCLAMIETAEAMANLEEIVSTPGLDGVYVGPADLALGVSNGALPPGLDRQEPEMIAAIKKIAAAARNAGIRAGVHCSSPDYAARAIGWGYDLVTLSNDVRMLAGAASASVSQTRALIAGGQSGEGASERRSKKGNGGDKSGGGY